MNTQSNNNSNTDAFDVLVFEGVKVLVAEGQAEDYLHMRARQLSALAHIVASEAFFCWNRSTKISVASLVSSLADEVDQLVPLAISEAKNPRDNFRDNRAGTERNGEACPLGTMPLDSP